MIKSSCMKRESTLLKRQVEALDNKDIICYKEESLAKYSLPFESLAGLEWGGEHLMDNM